VDVLQRAIKTVTGVDAELSTTGGTSDGRFIVDVCPQVAEFGPVNQTIHKVNECINLRDLASLPQIYQKVLGYLLAQRA
jgi:succinyl-diaminopimelate desuccinylase